MSFKDTFRERIWKNKKARALFITLVSVALAVLAAFIACAAYLNTYYRADDEGIAAFSVSQEVVQTQNKDGDWVVVPTETQPTSGFIFYPGGKVEHDAYLPLMRELAAHGVLCVLVEMPFRLAVFDIDAADGIAKKYPAVTKWYIGGHSLGGSMAASYVKAHKAAFEGLVLLASYSTENLVNSGLRVLSVYGDKDGVLNKQKYKENKKNLPSGYIEYIIAGGNHAYFGMYGEQSGDHKAEISNERQIRLTAAEIAAFIGETEFA